MSRKLPLLLSAAVIGLTPTLMSSAAHATVYGLSEVDIQNLLFSSIPSFVGGANFETNNTITGAGVPSNPSTDSGPSGTVADGTSLTGGRASTGAVALGPIGGSNVGGVSTIPTVGNSPVFGTSDSIITGTKTNVAGGAVAGGSWRASAEGAITSGSATITSTQNLTWNLNTHAGSPLAIDFDVSLGLKAITTSPGGTSKVFWTLALAYNGDPNDPFGQTDAQRTVNLVSSVSGSQSADQTQISVFPGCTKSVVDANYEHVHCDLTLPADVDPNATPGQFTLTSTEQVQLTANREVPEPATLGILGLGLLGLGYRQYRQRS
jgi:hypothetical protein